MALLAPMPAIKADLETIRASINITKNTPKNHRTRENTATKTTELDFLAPLRYNILDYGL